MSRPAQLEQQIEHVKQLQAEMLNPKPVPDEPVEPTTPTAVAPVQPVVDMPVTISKEDYDRLEQKYRTLQGMHNAEGSRLRGELSAAQAAIQSLENRIAAAETQAATQSTPVKYVTKEDEDEYGETLEMVRRAAREEAENFTQSREAAYLNRIAELEAKVGHVQNTVMPAVEDIRYNQAEQIKADFWADINTQVPNWRTINASQAFKDWLVSEDPLTGATRQQFLSQAQNEYNSSRVVKFFKEWERSQAGGPTPAPKPSQSELERYVAPGTSRSTAPVSNEPKSWTRAEIQAFYHDAMMGKYAKEPEKRKKIESDIYRAQAEGRIT